MIDNELRPTKNFVSYTNANREVKLKVFSILEIIASELFPFWKQFKRKINIDALGTTRKIRSGQKILIKY